MEPRPVARIFRASNAPAGVLRLRDGRLVLAWNNEFGIPFRDGISYSRQSLVMAIHDGGTWKGYRELNTFGPDDNLDGYGGMRYPFLVETPDHHVLVAYSEDGRASSKKQQFRSFVDYRLARVDPRWLLETEAREDFSQGTAPAIGGDKRHGDSAGTGRQARAENHQASRRHAQRLLLEFSVRKKRKS